MTQETKSLPASAKKGLAIAKKIKALHGKVADAETRLLDTETQLAAIKQPLSAEADALDILARAHRHERESHRQSMEVLTASNQEPIDQLIAANADRLNTLGNAYLDAKTEALQELFGNRAASQAKETAEYKQFQRNLYVLNLRCQVLENSDNCEILLTVTDKLCELADVASFNDLIDEIIPQPEADEGEEEITLEETQAKPLEANRFVEVAHEDGEYFHCRTLAACPMGVTQYNQAIQGVSGVAICGQNQEPVSVELGEPVLTGDFIVAGPEGRGYRLPARPGEFYVAARALEPGLQGETISVVLCVPYLVSGLGNSASRRG